MTRSEAYAKTSSRYKGSLDGALWRNPAAQQIYAHMEDDWPWATLAKAITYMVHEDEEPSAEELAATAWKACTVRACGIAVECGLADPASLAPLLVKIENPCETAQYSAPSHDEALVCELRDLLFLGPWFQERWIQRQLPVDFEEPRALKFVRSIRRMTGGVLKNATLEKTAEDRFIYFWLRLRNAPVLELDEADRFAFEYMLSRQGARQSA